MSNNEVAVILEDINGKFDAVMEYVRDIPDMKHDIAVLKEDVSELKFDMKLVKTVVQEHSYEIRELKASLA